MTFSENIKENTTFYGNLYIKSAPIDRLPIIIGW